MYFVGIMIFIIIGNIILFIGNGLNDLCNWRDAKDSWNPYTQSKNKYWIDHKGRTRYVCNGKIKDGNIEAKEISDKKEKDRIRFNELSKKKAIQENKTVYDYQPDSNELPVILNKKDNVFFKDLKTGDIYIKRIFDTVFPNIIYYMDVKTGKYVREADDTLIYKEVKYTDHGYILKENNGGREKIKRYCEEHNNTRHINIEDYYDLKHYYIVCPSCFLSTLETDVKNNIKQNGG